MEKMKYTAEDILVLTQYINVGTTAAVCCDLLF
jgi:hypothetical protein